MNVRGQRMPPHSEPRPLWLLLLPSPPKAVTSESIRTLYASTIAQVLQKAAEVSSSFSSVTILDVVVPYSDVDGSQTFIYSDLQNLLGQLYRLICLLCAEHSIDVQYGNDVDVRILLVKDPSTKSSNQQRAVNDSSSIAAILDLQKLASCGRPWQRICSMDSENGEVLLQLFLRLRNSSLDNIQDRLVVERFSPLHPFPAIRDTTSQSTPDDLPRARHASVAVGGTFDHLHAGHKLLLSMTALILNSGGQSGAGPTREITVGITGDALLESKRFREHLQDWQQRQAAVQAFLLAFIGVEAPLKQVSSSDKVDGEDRGQRIVVTVLPGDLAIKYVEIFDAFGPTVTDESITALVLSGETRSGGNAVNEKRAEKGWPPLDIFEVDVLDPSPDDGETSKRESQGFENKISSTEIRRRLAKRSGTAD